jgi:hypothetical protein
MLFKLRHSSSIWYKSTIPLPDFRPSSDRPQSFSVPPDGLGGMDVSKEFEQQAMKYDSTGMFHWCPARSLEECVLVSIYFTPGSRRYLGSTPSSNDGTQWACCCVFVCG